MEEQQDIYAPPTADLAQATEADGVAQFYVVGRTKFTVLFLMTMGIYAIYWFYKNWALYRDSMQISMIPVLRAIFAIFFTHALFAEVDAKLKSTNREFSWSASGLATLYVVLLIVTYFADTILQAVGFYDELSMTAFAVTMIITFGALIGSWLIIGKAQRAINTAANDPDGNENSHLTGANWVWIIIGAVYWAAVIFGLGVMYYVAAGGGIPPA